MHKLLTLIILILTACEPAKTVPPIPKPVINVAGSACAKYDFKDRGRLPVGLIVGMAKVFAEKAACQPMDSLGASEKDALMWYGVAPSQPKLWALLIGLAARESSGKLCCGIDQSSDNFKKYVATGRAVPADETEAGPFQFSYNSISADYGTAEQSRLRKLYAYYKDHPSECELDAFKDGMPTCSSTNLKNWGTGEGATFQKLSKECPAFTAQYAAILVRVLRKHFGPLKTKAAEIPKVCEDLFSQIQAQQCSTP